MNWSNFKSLRTWLHGLVAAVIGGGASTLTVAFADPGAVQFTAAGIRHMLQVASAGGLICALAYLKQSPLPPAEQK